jgi:molybdenum cofactor biosynthesis enzyme MoaA
MYNKIKQLHIELTDKCNARCPQCIRTNIETGKPQDWILKKELTLKDIKKIISLDDLASIEKVNFCGNFGDPLIATDIISICDYILKNTQKKDWATIELHTNGSMHNEDWWWELCTKLHTYNKRIRFVFGIDGINQEQHSRYRVGTKFDKIINNATMCIDAGFEVFWDYLVFKHNENYIDVAREMSEKLNFSKLNIISTERFWDGDSLEYIYKDKKYTLERSTIEPNKKQLMNIETYSDKKEITCFAKARQEAYIDCLGYITPCCYLGMFLYASVVNKPNKQANWHRQNETINMFNNIDLNRLQGKNKGLSEVIKDPWFSQLVQMHLDLKPERCYKVCGAKINKKEYVC